MREGTLEPWLSLAVESCLPTIFPCVFSPIFWTGKRHETEKGEKRLPALMSADSDDVSWQLMGPAYGMAPALHLHGCTEAATGATEVSRLWRVAGRQAPTTCSRQLMPAHPKCTITGQPAAIIEHDWLETLN